MNTKSQKLLQDAYSKPFLDLDTTIEVLYSLGHITNDEHTTWTRISHNLTLKNRKAEEAILFDEVFA